MRPLTLKSYNIGEQDGLYQFLHWLYDKSTDITHNMILCDINIYWRTIRLYHNPKSDMRHIISHNIFVLGFWHPYKELCILIWRNYYWLFAPIYHLLWNDKKILVKPKLYHLEQIYTWFMIAWSDDDIGNLITNYMNRITEYPATIQHYLKNIQLLFTYYLPMLYFSLGF